jgi:hypothetical protein
MEDKSKAGSSHPELSSFHFPLPFPLTHPQLDHDAHGAILTKHSAIAAGLMDAFA